MTSSSKNVLFLFGGYWYMRVSEGNKHTNETFVLGRPLFHATSHLKIEAK